MNFDESFAQGDSPLHRIDPRARLLVALAGAVVLAGLQTLSCSALALAAAGGLLALGRPPRLFLMRRLLAVNVFILFLWLTVPLASWLWTAPNVVGAVDAAGAPDTVGALGAGQTGAGVHLAALVTLKANALTLLFLALVASMETATLGHALGRLGLPSRLVFLLLFTYRHIHVLAAEWERLQTAARLRGFVPRSNRHTYRTLGNMIGMVFLRAFDRASRVSEAMKLRAFSGRFHSLAVFRARPRDAVFVVSALAGLAILLAFDFGLDLTGGTAFFALLGGTAFAPWGGTEVW